MSFSVTRTDIEAAYPMLRPDQNVDLAIATANNMIKSIVASGCAANYSDETLRLMTISLATYVFLIQHGIITSISTDGASESYQMSTDFFLKGSLQGQQLLLLDSNQCFAQLMGNTQAALDGKMSFPPGVVSLHSKYRTPVMYGGRYC